MIAIPDVLRRLLAAVAALLAVAALAGCAGSGSSGSTAAPATSGGAASRATGGGSSGGGGALAPASPTTDLRTVAVDALPAEAITTLHLIAAGGPYPYSKDGVVFGNRERILPRQPSGFYHEYTVKTPGSSDRGARRIVTGEDGSRFYTDDHYSSFREVVSS